MEKTKEDKLGEIKDSMDNNRLFYVPKEKTEEFEKKSKEEGRGAMAIMTYGDKVVYLRAEGSTLPKIDLSKFNYTSGTFEKKWGQDHKTIILTPNHSSIRKVEIEIQGMDISNMKLLPGKTGDVFEDNARVKITRHYRFLEGDSENKKDSNKASPGETDASKIE